MLAIDLSLLDLAEEIFHTRALLRAYPFLAAQADQLDALYPEWLQLMQDELALVREQLEVEARAIAVDDACDFLCVAISATLLAEAGGDRKSASYQRYFGAAPPSRLKRPVLGQQLEVMRTWVPSLIGAPSSPTLQGYGQQLAERVGEADQVIRALSEAERKRADFEIGPRKAFVDKLNALRQALYGQLAELPLRRPALNLSRDFAHRFFLRDASSRKAGIPELEQIIFRLRERLRKHEAELARLVEAEEAEARLREDAELAEAEAELAEAEQQRATAAERVAAVRAQRKARTPQRQPS